MRPWLSTAFFIRAGGGIEGISLGDSIVDLLPKSTSASVLVISASHFGLSGAAVPILGVA